jgi:nucleoside 2-deoxyribosyltransferase
MSIKIPCLLGARCYLSGPIECDTTSFNWREQPVQILTTEFGINVFDPHADPKQQWLPQLKEAKAKKDYEKMSTIAHAFVRKDLSIVDRSDFLISYLPAGVRTTGTVHEIINSVNSKKPTLLVSEHKEDIPLWFYGFIPHEVMFSGWDELYSYLKDVNEGKHIHNRRWAFIYGII